MAKHYFEEEILKELEDAEELYDIDIKVIHEFKQDKRIGKNKKMKQERREGDDE